MKNHNIGNSIYQKECKKYYSLFRKLHSETFTLDKNRIIEEKTKIRYSECNIENIENLYSFINILVELLKSRKNVNGVDFGCGSHYFVDDMHKQYGWNVTGFDSDKYAIQIAKLNFQKSSKKYIHLDLLKNKLPLDDNSQDFVFCNSVIQHFGDEEVLYCFEEINRILKPEGFFLLIFKYNLKNWTEYTKETGVKVNVLDSETGEIEIEDIFMKMAISKLKPSGNNNILLKYSSGMRLFHFLNIVDVLEKARLKGFREIKLNLSLQNGKKNMTYLSGKKIPHIGIFFKKLI